jgi:hypothetical protein
MHKLPMSPLLVALALSLPLAACASSSRSRPAARETAPTAPAGETVYVVDGYGAASPTTSAAQRLVVFQPGSANPGAYFSLPAGLTSQDRQHLYAATAQAGRTTIAVLSTRTGAVLRTVAVPGTYSTVGRGYTTATISPDGRWLALRDLASLATSTQIALVDTQAGQLSAMIHLDGDFDLDAISPDGKMLYLLQNLRDAAHHYYVRAYDVAAGRLLDTIISDKSRIDDPQMRGFALTRQTGSGGRVDYTLYVDPAANVAFVHALPLGSGPNDPPFASCIFLPAGASGDLLRYYTLALSPDESTLYAANAALGVVSRISLAGPDVFADRIAATGRFDPGTVSTASASGSNPFYEGAALSADGRSLYVAGPHGIWSVRTDDLTARGPYLSQQTLTGLALSAHGEILYAADPEHGLTLLSLASGQARLLPAGPARSPWGIAWIVG